MNYNSCWCVILIIFNKKVFSPDNLLPELEAIAVTAAAAAVVVAAVVEHPVASAAFVVVTEVVVVVGLLKRRKTYILFIKH